jgi:hypothetical protein
MNTRVSRFTLTSLAMLALLLFGQVQTVAAVAPIREPLPAGSFTISGVCDFDVSIEVLTNNEYFTTFTDQSGNVTMQLITGALKLRLTNVSTGESIDLNVPGPGRILPHGDNSSTWMAQGPWLWFLLPGDLPGFEPRLFYISGRVVAEFDAGGNLVQLTVVGGHLVDLCAELSA